MLVLLVESTHQRPPTSVGFIETSFCPLPVQTGQPLAKHPFSWGKQYRTQGWRQDTICTERSALAKTCTHCYVLQSALDKTEAQGFVCRCHELPSGLQLRCHRLVTEPGRVTALPDPPASPGAVSSTRNDARLHWDPRSTNCIGVKPLMPAASAD